MDALLTVLTSLGGVVFGGVFLYLGNRYVANKSNEVGKAQVEVESRKVDREAFEQFTRTYERELQKLQEQIDRYGKWLVSSLQHIRQLRSDVIHNRELSPFPEELKSIPFWLLADDDEPLPRQADDDPAPNRDN